MNLSAAPHWRERISDWRVLWLLLLLPVALFLPATPIDETRYLAVAWEMRRSGDLLLLHLNGAPYADKGPLLFWLINFGWLVAGVHVWVVRIGILAASMATLILFDTLARRLHPRGELAAHATLILAGILFFALFSSAIMFDVVLATCVLIALHGVLDLDARRWRNGTLILALGLGLGLLTKGPVVLLDVGLVALLAPWWSTTAREHKAGWYGCFLLGVLGGMAIALIWAIAAYGVQGFWETIVLRQTVGRVTKSFAHARPIWWYLMVLPLMLLPWTVSLRAPWRAWRDSFVATKAARFGMAWFLPAFVVFCFFSGKQMHYLLPLLPGLALYLAAVLGHEGASLRGRLFAVLLLLVGIVLTALPYLAANAHDIPVLNRLIRNGELTESLLLLFGGVWPLWGLMAIVLGLGLLMRGRATVSLRSLALSSVAASSIGMLALAQGVGPYLDVSAAAMRIAQAQAAGTPIAHLGWHHGLFEFAGRLTQPLEKVDYANLRTWCVAHPDGEIVTIYTKYPITAKAELELPYRLGHRIIFWRAADLLAEPLTEPPVKADEDDTPDD